MVDEKCESRECSAPLNIPDIPEVREYWKLTKGRIPEFSVETICAYQFHLRNFVSPYYTEAVHAAIIRHVMETGQDPSHAQGMIPMSELLDDVMDCLQEKAVNDSKFCDGFWAALMDDIVTCTQGADELRQFLSGLNSVFRDQLKTEDERNIDISSREDSEDKEVG